MRKGKLVTIAKGYLFAALRLGLFALAVYFELFTRETAVALIAYWAYLEATGALNARVRALEEVTNSVSSLARHHMRKLPKSERNPERAIRKDGES